MGSEEIKAKIAKKEAMIENIHTDIHVLRNMLGIIRIEQNEKPQTNMAAPKYFGEASDEMLNNMSESIIKGREKSEPFLPAAQGINEMIKTIIDLSKRVAALENPNTSTAKFYTNSTGGLTSKM